MASGRLDVPLAQPAINAVGQVTAGATLTFYNTGTTNLAAVYADADLSTPVANPQAGIYSSNSAGRFTVQTDTFWLDASAAYDVVLGFPDGSSLTFLQQYVLGAATNTSGFAPINSPVFTGNPQAPTPATNDNSSSIATTAFVVAQGFAPLNSPTFTGTPAGPTASPGTSTTELATTAFVTAALTAIAAGVAKAWVSFVGSSAAIADQLNVASVVRNAAGTYSVTFTANMANANYALDITVGMGTTVHANNSPTVGIVSKSTTGFQFVTSSSTDTTAVDPPLICCTVFSH